MTLASRRAVCGGIGIALATGRATAAADPAVAHTRHGPVRGVAADGVVVFKGVRYGADTTGRRFQPPAPPAPWTDVRPAFAYAAACPQERIAEPVSEDCLFLNVWTPRLREGRRPVMVYLHGGAYSTGSGSHPTYDGSRLVRRGDVVVVTLNHRLNAFGYLSLPGEAGYEDSGNVGQLDLILALCWVRDNIAEFGGDPGCVTVFGQSGGGAKIATLMATPAAAGLFHRAATLSGQQVTASGPDHAAQRTAAFLDALSLRPGEGAKAARLPADALVRALATVDPIIGRGGLYFGPVFDGRSLKRHPFYPDAPQQSAHIPMLIGGVRDETRYFLGRNEPSAFTLGWDDLPPRLVKEMRADLPPAMVIAAYRGVYPAYSPSDVFFAATTAGRSWRGGVIEAELRARQGSPAYVYQLDWRSPVRGGRLGAFHTLDIPLVFDTVAAGREDTGGGADAQAMADQMSEALLAFARTGDPSTPGSPWAPYTLPRRRTRVFDRISRMEDDPRGAERRLFAAAPFIQQGT